MKFKFISPMLLGVSLFSTMATACDYNYTDSNGNEICANSGEREVTITTTDGDEHAGRWIGNGLVEDSESGETSEVTN